MLARHGEGAPSYLNCAIADGANAVVSRFANDPSEGPPTLYYYLGQLYPNVDPATEWTGRAEAMIVSSERLTASIGWEVIPPNHLVLLTRDAPPELRPLARLASAQPDPTRQRRRVT